MEKKLRSMTSICLVNDTGILCLYRIGSRVVNNQYIGSAGGHFEPEEWNDLKRCAVREMGEELGLSEADIEGLRLRYVTLRLKNGEIRQNYYFFARLKEERELKSTEGILRWISYSDLPGLDMPVTAKHVMLHYLREGQFTDWIYGGIVQEDGTEFAVLREF